VGFPESLSAVLDRWLRAFAPRWALARQRARIEAGALMSEQTRPTYTASMGGAQHPDTDLIPDSGKQRRRCTLAYYNNPIVKGIVDSEVRQTINSLQVQASTGDKSTDDRIEDEWRRRLDDGVLETVQQAVRHLLIDGGCVPRPLGTIADPVDFEVLPYRRIKTPYFSGSDAPAVRDGFEYDASGKPIAVYVESEESSYDAVYAGVDYTRVPLFSHIVLPRLAGQTKGLSWFHAAIARLEMVNRWMLALLHSAELHAYVVAIVRTGNAPGSTLRTALGSEKDSAGERDVLTYAKEHRFLFLPEGQDYKLLQASAPQIAEFLVWNLRFIARALGVSFERLTYDLSKTSFSSTKFGDRDDRITVAEHQRLVERHLLRPLNVRLLAGMHLRPGMPGGAFAADPDGYAKQVRFALPGRPPVDELKAEKANVLALANRTASRSRIAAERGLDYAEVKEDLCREDRQWFEARVQMWKDLGFSESDARDYAREDVFVRARDRVSELEGDDEGS